MSFYMRYDDEMVGSLLSSDAWVLRLSLLFHGTFIRTLKGCGLNLSLFLHRHILEFWIPSGLCSHL
jgi:hypothetical protein